MTLRSILMSLPCAIGSASAHEERHKRRWRLLRGSLPGQRVRGEPAASVSRGWDVGFTLPLPKPEGAQWQLHLPLVQLACTRILYACHKIRTLPNRTGWKGGKHMTRALYRKEVAMPPTWLPARRRVSEHRCRRPRADAISCAEHGFRRQQVLRLPCSTAAGEGLSNCARRRAGITSGEHFMIPDQEPETCGDSQVVCNGLSNAGPVVV
jgi:hypothetical protein